MFTEIENNISWQFIKAQQEWPQASNRQSLVTLKTEGSPFQRQLDRRTYQGAYGKHHYSKHGCNTSPTRLSTGALLCKQLSAEAHPDSKEQMGCVKQLCTLWCVTMCHCFKVENQQGRLFCDKNFSTWGFSCIYISSKRNRKDQRLRVQAGERSGVTGAIARHWAPTVWWESVAAGSSPHPNATGGCLNLQHLYLWQFQGGPPLPFIVWHQLLRHFSQNHLGKCFLGSLKREWENKSETPQRTDLLAHWKPLLENLEHLPRSFYFKSCLLQL